MGRLFDSPHFSLKFSDIGEQPEGICDYSGAMFRYRFITPHRRGKWYPDLATAQRFADSIGAGFLERRSGRFFAYRDTRLEIEPV